MICLFQTLLDVVELKVPVMNGVNFLLLKTKQTVLGVVRRQVRPRSRVLQTNAWYRAKFYSAQILSVPLPSLPLLSLRLPHCTEMRG